jgi:hypothetical protein
VSSKVHVREGHVRHQQLLQGCPSPRVQGRVPVNLPFPSALGFVGPTVDSF